MILSSHIHIYPYRFDHYAHLGGALFGALYYQFGRDLWDSVRVLLMVVDGHVKPGKKDEPKL